jgi:fructokinase
MIVVTTERRTIARTLSDLHRPVEMLAVDGRLPHPVIALHAAGAYSPSVEGLIGRERARLTISLDLLTHPSPLIGAPRIQRQLGRAHLVTASVDVVESLYPGMPAVAVAASWRELGVACGVIVSERDGVLLLAPNGLSYRRFTPGAAYTHSAFVAGLLDELATIGALGDDPGARLAGLGAQDWLDVLERAEAVARSYGREAVLAG